MKKNKLLKNEDLMTQVKSLIASYHSQAQYKKQQAMLDADIAADYYHQRRPCAATTGGSVSVAPIVKSKTDDATIQIMDIVGRLKEGTTIRSPYSAVSYPPELEAMILGVVDKALWAAGPKVMNAAIRDSLICGTSAVRWYVEEEPITEIQHFIDKDKFEVELIKADAASQGMEVKITNEKKIPGLKANEGLGNKLFDGMVVRTTHKKVVKYKHVPFNQLFVETHNTSMKEASYVGIEYRTTKINLVEQGFDRELVETIVSETSYEYQAQVNTGIDYLSWNRLGSEYIDHMMDEVIVRECWVRTTFIDKVANLYRVVMVGNTILDIQPADSIPVADITPIPNISTFWGVSFASLLLSAQDKATALLRGYIDNIHNANNGRVMALTGQYNKRDMIDNRPNGIVEIEVPGAIQPFPYNPLPAGIDNLLAIIEKEADDISGISNEMLGRSDQAWNSHLTEGQVALNYSKGDLTIKAYTQGIIFGIQQLAKGLYTEWSKINEGLPPVHEFIMTFETESGRRSKARDAVSTYQMISQTPFMTPQLQYLMIKEYLSNTSQTSFTQYLKPVQQVQQEQSQPKPAEQLNQALVQGQIENLQSQTKLNLQKADIEAVSSAGEENRKDLEIQLKLQTGAMELDLKERAQTMDEFKTTVEAELAQKELQSKNLALIYEQKYQEMFSAGEIMRSNVSDI